MDISEITDVVQLKSMAYDCIVQIERNRSNLQVIEQQIAKISSDDKPTPAPEE